MPCWRSSKPIALDLGSLAGLCLTSLTSIPRCSKSHCQPFL
jgi:hypothetical protein